MCWNGGVCGPVIELAMSRLWPSPNGSTTLAPAAGPGTRARTADDSGAAWRFAVLCTPLLGAGAWLALMHGGFSKEARRLSSMSLTQQRERTTHMAAKALFLFGAVSVLNAPQASVESALTHTSLWFGASPVLMPKRVGCSHRHIIPRIIVCDACYEVGMILTAYHYSLMIFIQYHRRCT